MQCGVKNDELLAERVPERISWEQLKTAVEKLLLNSLKAYTDKHGYSITFVRKNNVELVKQKVMYEIQAKENRKD